jgi:surfeit locus 1 family protein
MKYFHSLLSRKYIFLWIFSLFLVFVFFRLGLWQLDRLDQRRNFNSRVTSQINQPELNLTGEAILKDLYQMEYRKVEAIGEYRFEDEIAIRNQVFENQPGVHLVTPLVLAGTNQAILVDRGWIPYEDFQRNNWSLYNEPGKVKVSGVLRRSQTKPDFGNRSDPTPAPGEPRKPAWFFVNVAGIQKQIPYELLPGAYIQQSPDPGWTDYPKRSTVEVEISEGPHLGYAIQWFTFSFIALVGVPILVIWQENRAKIEVKGSLSSSKVVL